MKIDHWKMLLRQDSQWSSHFMHAANYQGQIIDGPAQVLPVPLIYSLRTDSQIDWLLYLVHETAFQSPSLAMTIQFKCEPP